MFDTKRYKSAALSQLKKRWKMPCIFSVASIAIIMCAFAGLVGRAGFLMEVTAIGIFGMIATALIYNFMKLQSAETELTFESFFEGFDNWVHSLLGTLWFCLWTFLWSLLFFIPGVVKALSYSMMFCVIAENPEINVKKAMNISKVLTDCNKANLFGFIMSFLGWFILSCLSGGIGFIWLCPYFGTAWVNAYYDLKLRAFEKGTLKPADFAE